VIANADASLECVIAADGVRLAVHRLGPAAGQPVVLVPGTFSNATFWLGTRRVGLARLLAARGFDTWSLDPRGHGMSERAASGVHWSCDRWGRADAPAVIRQATRHGRHAVVVGHSAGGAALLSALVAEPDLTERVAAAVIIATPLPWLHPWRRAGAHAIRLASMLLREFPARALRIGPENEAASVMRQWMDWNIQRRWVGDDGTDYLAALGEVRLPVLALAGAGDSGWAPPHACEAVVRHLGGGEVDFRVLGRDTGFSHDFGHVDIVAGRAARAEVWPLVAEWLSRPARS
jgi:pimeloyl-ACP methyl ester carboxylesterase